MVPKPAGDDVPSAPQGSVTQCIARFKAGERGAFDKIWEHYFNDLVKVARKFLASRPKGALIDEEDIVQNALWSLCRGLPRNRSFDAVDSRESLWPILVAITKYKVNDHFRREGAQKRGSGKVFNQLSSTPGDDDRERRGISNLLADEAPTADDIVSMSEQLALLLNLLPKDDLCQIAKLHIEGWKNAEIAEKLAISVRGVERKLALVRDTWFEWWQKQDQC
ncbi:MAG: ECF-type sigma factor [Pirellulales bacterium]